MASSKENALHEVYFTQEDDSLSFKWTDPVWISNNRYVWCNPPYSNPKPWIEKALESQRSGLGVVMLLNTDDSTEWFNIALNGVSEIRRITGYYDGEKFKSGRLDFIDDNGKPAKGNNKAQFILVFNPFKIGNAVTTYIPKNHLMSAN